MTPPTLTPGTRLGPFEILSSLGEGGMGAVYRARDTKLDRDVALKVLLPAVASDPERLARFQREAKVLAALNHPNIGHIHGLEDADGVTALVLELVEGPTLADRIAHGPIPLDEALPIAKQIAEALEAAHEQGIIHRDLKPANIKVRDDGTVKVLDFGLAKAMDPVGGSSASASMSPTLTTPAMTGMGVILGTAAYMSPEQAKGRPVDKRADLWAFGAVLYEMLTGRRCFEGENLSDTLAHVLMKDPDWTALPLTTPAPIRKLLRRCLERDRKKRLPDAADIRLEIDDASTDPTAETPTPVVPQPRLSALRRVAPYAAAILLALVTGLAVWRVTRPIEAPRPLVRFSIDLPAPTQLSTAEQNPVAMSPDGTRLAYVANERLYLRALDQLAATPMAGTEVGGIGGFGRAPFFSPDGRWIAFWQTGQLRKVAVSGGAPVTICEMPEVLLSASWGSNDEILLGAGTNGILQVAGTGGTLKPLLAVQGGERASVPQALPGGEWVLFVLHTAADPRIEQGQVVVQSRSTGARRVLIEGVRDVRYVPSGHLVFGRGNALLAQAFDARHLTLSGGPVPVLDGVANSAGNSPGMHFAVSSTGTLLYVPGSASATSLTRLVQVARDGTGSLLADVTGMTWFPRFSPDGSRVAFGISAGTGLADASDLWVLEVARGARTRVTFTGNNRFYPLWTRDGTRLTFADSGPNPTNRILSALADGSARVQTLLDVGPRRFPTSWSPDGHTLAIYVGPAGTPTNTRDLWMVQVDGDKRTPAPFVEAPFEERGAIFSPDGHWVAYVSNKSGQNDIYARPYPGPSGEVTISVGGGQEPVWAPSGQELFYRHDGKLLAVKIDQTVSSLAVGEPTRVFDDPYRLDTGGTRGGMANYDVSPDGRRFVMVEELRPTTSAGTEPVRLQVILNWFEALKAHAPTK